MQYFLSFGIGNIQDSRKCYEYSIPRENRCIFHAPHPSRELSLRPAHNQQLCCVHSGAVRIVSFSKPVGLCSAQPWLPNKRQTHTTKIQFKFHQIWYVNIRCDVCECACLFAAKTPRECVNECMHASRLSFSHHLMHHTNIPDRVRWFGQFSFTVQQTGQCAPFRQWQCLCFQLCACIRIRMYGITQIWCV